MKCSDDIYWWLQNYLTFQNYLQVNQYQVEHVLEVTSPLNVHIFPMTQVTDSGSTAVFNCTVDGFPVLNVYWLKNGQIVVPSGRISPGTGSLTIRRVGVEDRGQYQCVAGNEEEESQASATLMLGGEFTATLNKVISTIIYFLKVPKILVASTGGF